MNPKKILLIEDDSGYRSLVARFLRGADLTFAFNFQEAIAALEKDKYDMIILDMILPDWKGKPDSLLAYVAARGKGAPLAVISARADHLPDHCCNASAFKANLTTPEAWIQFIADAERDAAETVSLTRQVDGLEHWLAAMRPKMAAA